MKTTKILVLGANGKTGRRVLERLEKNANVEVRAGSRSAAIPFDWEKPETWQAALKDIDSVYISYQPDLAIPSATTAIQLFSGLATQMGVTKMVLLSGRGEKEAQVCEEIVKPTLQIGLLYEQAGSTKTLAKAFS